MIGIEWGREKKGLRIGNMVDGDGLRIGAIGELIILVGPTKHPIQGYTDSLLIGSGHDLFCMQPNVSKHIGEARFDELSRSTVG